LTGFCTILLFLLKKLYENKFYQKWSFLKLNALKMSEITVFDVIDEEVAVLPSFLKSFVGI
jgi:hypothetical protein